MKKPPAKPKRVIRAIKHVPSYKTELNKFIAGHKKIVYLSETTVKAAYLMFLSKKAKLRLKYKEYDIKKDGTLKKLQETRLKTLKGAQRLQDVLKQMTTKEKYDLYELEQTKKMLKDPEFLEYIKKQHNITNPELIIKKPKVKRNGKKRK